jgi:hypothetical protein
MAHYFTDVEAAGSGLFNGPEGNYGDLTAVSTALQQFAQAEGALTAAQSSTKATSALFLIGLLRRNIDYAMADTAISYYTLKGDSSESDAAKSFTQQLVQQNRFAGIIDQNWFSMRRYDSTVTWYGTFPSVLRQYATGFHNSCQ